MKIIAILLIFFFISGIINQFNPKEIMGTIMALWLFLLLPIFIGLITDSVFNDEMGN